MLSLQILCFQVNKNGKKPIAIAFAKSIVYSTFKNASVGASFKQRA